MPSGHQITTNTSGQTTVAAIHFLTLRPRVAFNAMFWIYLGHQAERGVDVAQGSEKKQRESVATLSWGLKPTRLGFIWYRTAAGKHTPI